MELCGLSAILEMKDDLTGEGARTNGEGGLFFFVFFCILYFVFSFSFLFSLSLRAVSLFLSVSFERPGHAREPLKLRSSNSWGGCK